MAIQPPGRSENRIAAEMSVVLTSLAPVFPVKTELSKTENISGHGARVSTKQSWSANESLVIRSLVSGLQSEARVIYCQRIRTNVFAIGLELIASSSNWQGK